MQASAIKNAVEKQYPYRIELHAHTCPVSRCSEYEPEKLIKTYAELGFHGIVITNHFIPDLMTQDPEAALAYYLQDYEAARAAGEKYGISVYLGAEIRFTENFNDYLLYGVDKDILRTCYHYLEKGVEAFRQEVSLPNSVFLQAHPFRNGMQLCDPALLDGVECLNVHPHHNSRVAMATRYAYEKGLTVKTAGTDCHHLTHEGLSALRTQTMPRDSFELAKLLKSGDFVFEVGDHSFWIP